jgi:NtrC-family two-component system response regulator AlgB
MSGRVLVVDDDPAVLRTLVTTMTRCGHSAVSSGDVAGALALVASEPLDILLVDLHIGAESGLEVVRACRERHGQFVFIAMLTGDDDEEMRTLAAGAGANLVLAKPVSAAALRSHVHEALAQLRSAA